MLAIFDGGYESQPSPNGFTARRVPLRATLYDRLDWNSSYDIAKAAVARNERILWDLDLGLFSRLPLPLSDEGQFHACMLAVETLLKEIQQHFLEVSLGVSLYRGSADMRRGFPWDVGVEDNAQDQLITCRDRCWQFLRELVVNWPDTIALFAMLDARGLSPFLQLTLLHREQLGRFCPILRGISEVWKFPRLGWEEWAPEGTLSRQHILAPEKADAVSCVQGLLMPSKPMDVSLHPALETAFLQLETLGAPTRILTESSITAEWDGLDRIFTIDEVPPLAKRALQGFAAAGGEVLSLLDLILAN